MEKEELTQSNLVRVEDQACSHSDDGSTVPFGPKPSIIVRTPSRKQDQVALKSAKRMSNSLNFKNQIRRNLVWASRLSNADHSSYLDHLSGTEKNLTSDSNEEAESQRSPSMKETDATIEVGEVVGFHMAGRGRQVLEAIMGEGNDSLLQ
ncbi:hypothetical protein QVD17_36705 [Tagetes erecta]|uniref:Uncharacterized protein n=1 Tax=Tagetes erecta TaxID=13708 RepID=A0AAD8JZ49_TARER|nr:hypothetical protein QVD17_36705 [Tagetes erecta]